MTLIQFLALYTLIGVVITIPVIVLMRIFDPVGFSKKPLLIQLTYLLLWIMMWPYSIIMATIGVYKDIRRYK